MEKWRPFVIIYALDGAGNITKTTHIDGSLWDYLYDGRYRLTMATRSNDASPDDTIKAVYEYTYDDGDNLTTKVTPFEENFNDGNYTGWTVNQGVWIYGDIRGQSPFFRVDSALQRVCAP